MKKSFYLGALVILAGCSNPIANMPTPTTVKVTGKVVLAGGQPLKSGTIRFEPTYVGKGAESYANIQSDGSFTLMSFGEKEGIAPGSYKAYIDPATVQTFDRAAGKMVFNGQAREIPQIYFKADTSRLSIEIGSEASSLGTLKLQ